MVKPIAFVRPSFGTSFAWLLGDFLWTLGTFGCHCVLIFFGGNRAKKKQVIRFAKLSARVTSVNLSFGIVIETTPILVIIGGE